MHQIIIAQAQKFNAQLIAVSKTQSLDKIISLYDAGQRAFGENRVQELVEKYNALPKDMEWHLIGHLQTNKVKYIVPFVHLIHSIESIKLLNEVENEASKINRTVAVLMQFHIAKEDTKYGLDLKEAIELLETYFAPNNQYKYTKIIGVMGMASFSENKDEVRKEFQHLKNIFLNLKNTYFPLDNDFKEISMGMSGDYELALEEGSTMLRVGSLLFK